MPGGRRRSRKRGASAVGEGTSGGGRTTRQKVPADDPSTAPPDEDPKETAGRVESDADPDSGKSLGGGRGGNQDQESPQPTAIPGSEDASPGSEQGEEGQFRVLPRKEPDSAPSSSRWSRTRQEPAPLRHMGLDKLHISSPSEPMSFAEMTRRHRVLPEASQPGSPQARSPQSPRSPQALSPRAPSSDDAIRDKRIATGLNIFLNSFREGESKVPFYPAKVNFMKEIGSYKLQVEFEHILQTDVDLAIDIVSIDHQRRNVLLLPHVQRFLVEQGLGTAEELNHKVSLEFMAIPRSIKRVKEYFAHKRDLVHTMTDLLGLGYDVRTLSDLTKALLHGFAEEIFQTHSENLMSWDGGYGLEDLLVIDNYQFRIAKRPSFVLVAYENGTKWTAARKKDLQRLEELFTPMLDGRRRMEQIGEPDDVDLPLFYSSLRDDLQHVKDEEIGTKWFEEYILNHASLKKAQTRNDLVCSLFQVLRKPMAKENVKLADIQTVLYQDPPVPDWRHDAAFGDTELLREIYAYNHDKEDDKGGSKKRDGEGVSTKTSEPEELLNRFTFDLWGSLKFNRHLLNHTTDKIEIKSIAEMETFASGKMGLYLTKLLRHMVTKRLVRLPLFSSIWENYVSNSVLTTDGSKIKPGPRLRFWS